MNKPSKPSVEDFVIDLLWIQGYRFRYWRRLLRAWIRFRKKGGRGRYE